MCGGGGWFLKVSLVLALVQHTRIWALDLDLDQAEQYKEVFPYQISVLNGGWGLTTLDYVGLP